MFEFDESYLIIFYTLMCLTAAYVGCFIGAWLFSGAPSYRDMRRIERRNAKRAALKKV